MAETRVAVRRALAALPVLPVHPVPDSLERSGDEDRASHAPQPPARAGAPLVLVALSGGADSLALAAATAFEAPRAGVRAGAVVVDHALQPGSAGVAERAASQARDLGLEPVLVRRVEVAVGGPGGPEAAAREARYAALEEAREELGAVAILTAHTRDDQAEQVLLALARGSGTRAIAGIPPARGAILRPFLGVSRETTELACAVQGLAPWRDPHNADPSFARVRVRERVLPVLERELGPGIAAGLARTAELAREDADALDGIASQRLAELLARTPEGASLPAPALTALPAALRHRVIRALARQEFGAHLGREHALAVAALATGWRGQGPIHVPGIEVSRTGDAILFRAPAR